MDELFAVLFRFFFGTGWTRPDGGSSFVGIIADFTKNYQDRWNSCRKKKGGGRRAVRRRFGAAGSGGDGGRGRKGVPGLEEFLEAAVNLLLGKVLGLDVVGVEETAQVLAGEGVVVGLDLVFESGYLPLLVVQAGLGDEEVDCHEVLRRLWGQE